MKEVRIIWLFMACISIIFAEEKICKHSLKCDMVHMHEEVPPTVSSLEDMFSKGVFYGRVRTNSFAVQWDKEVENKRKNHAIAAVGGSLTYRSAYYHGFSLGTGLYTTHSKGTLSSDEAKLYSAGKDVFSLDDYLDTGTKGITSIAEAYLEYQHKKTSIKAGRQIFESFLTKSNDTKMIPNTFEGLTLWSKVLPKTLVKMAYLTSQKLRGHSGFHHLLAYDGYSQNDDSAMHKGLTLSKLRDKGIEDKLIVLELKNSSVENMILRMNYTAVPELLSSAMVQADYIFEVGDWSVIPAFRYMKQFDNGAGKIAGANIRTLTSAYSNPESLDAALYASRIDVVKDAFKLRLGYTKVEDKADIVAPWRGFPTGGFTRAMSQYNWQANTESYMVQLEYALESIEDCKIISRFAVQDFDDAKEGVQADSKAFTFDVLKSFADKSMYVKTRFGHVVGDKHTIASNGVQKLNPSYNEFRFEVNYLF